MKCSEIRGALIRVEELVGNVKRFVNHVSSNSGKEFIKDQNR